jgi:hypothetical protein
MKKAKEYAQQLLDCKDNKELIDKELSKIITQLCSEIVDLSNNRKIEKESALKSIIKEQDQKWKAICNIVEKSNFKIILKRDGFINVIINKVPLVTIIFDKNELIKMGAEIR